MTVLLAMLVCRHSLKPQRPVPATVLVVSLLDSMQDACSAFKFVTSPCWVRGTFPRLHCTRRLQPIDRNVILWCLMHLAKNEKAKKELAEKGMALE
jgi:hypothetical protein